MIIANVILALGFLTMSYSIYNYKKIRGNKVLPLKYKKHRKGFL